MSPAGTIRSTAKAKVARRAKNPVPQPTVRENMSVLDDATIEDSLTTDPRPTRPVTPARVGPTRNAHPHPYNDPSNYLG